jgi:Uma2 family endonuclease
MSALKQSEQIFTVEEYLSLEDEAEFRSEYENGLIVAMAGSSWNHARIASNLTRFIGNKLSLDCSAVQSEIKIWVASLGKFYYPDVAIVCGDLNFYQTRNDAVTNPVLLIEVLSDSTEAKDRGEKFFAYQTLDSIKEYVLVSQKKAVVEQYLKQPDGSWRYSATIGLESTVNFESVGVEVSLKEIYQSINFKQ